LWGNQTSRRKCQQPHTHSAFENRCPIPDVIEVRFHDTCDDDHQPVSGLMSFTPVKSSSNNLIILQNLSFEPIMQLGDIDHCKVYHFNSARSFSKR
jgi:hypothetical protein